MRGEGGAQQALAVLERYTRDIRQLATDSPLDASYRNAVAHLEEIRRCCTLQPDLSLPLTVLLISHAEFLQYLWTGANAQPREPGELQCRAQAHLQRVDDLAQACYALLLGGSAAN